MLLDLLSEPRVAIIDDVEAETVSIRQALEERSINVQFFNASPEILQEAEQQIDSIELIFLDLYYNTNFGNSFNPEICAQIVQSIVPKGKQYTLVVWSRDTDKTSEVLNILEQINLSPVQTITKSKVEFSSGDHNYEVDRLLSEIDHEAVKVIQATKNIEVLNFYGEIIVVDDDNIIVDCLIDQENRKFQTRRFDRLPFEEVIKLEEGSFISVKIITRQGSKIFEFSEVSKDLASLFSKDSYFTDIDESIFKKK